MYRVNDVQFYGLNLHSYITVALYCHKRKTSSGRFSPKLFFTGTPETHLRLKLPVYTESSQMKIHVNGKVNIYLDKNEKNAQKVDAQHIYTSCITAHCSLPFVKQSSLFQWLFHFRICMNDKS